MEYSKETRQGWPSERDAVVRWMMMVDLQTDISCSCIFYFHKPYIVAKHEWSLLYDMQLWLVSYSRI